MYRTHPRVGFTMFRSRSRRCSRENAWASTQTRKNSLLRGTPRKPFVLEGGNDVVFQPLIRARLAPSILRGSNRKSAIASCQTAL